MKSYKARGIVLNRIKYGENGVVVQMLTDICGRQSYMVQGIRSTSGKGSKMALYQPLFPLEFEGLISSKMELHRIKEARSGVVLQSIPYDISKSTIALFMAQTIHNLVKESEQNSPLFNFIWDSIEQLDSLKEGVANFHIWFLTHLSGYLGFMPSSEYLRGFFFDMEEGCFTPIMPRHSNIFKQDMAELLHTFLESSVENLGGIALNRTLRRELLNLIVRYYSIHLDNARNITSIDILREVF